MISQAPIPATETRLAQVEAGLDRLGALDFARRYCASWWGLTLAEVVGHCRNADISRVRHALWAVLHWSLGLSYMALSRIFGAHHTTIIDGVRNRERELTQLHGGAA